MRALVPSLAPLWQQATEAFLRSKHGRSGSERTVETYGRVLRQFFGAVNVPPDQVRTAHVALFVVSLTMTGAEPARSTRALRLACLSSFYRYLVNVAELVPRNPCLAVDPVHQADPRPRMLSPDQAKRLLGAIPLEKRSGIRDRAIIVLGLLTGRRRAEMLGLRVRDLDRGGELVTYVYTGKGSRVRRRVLPPAAWRAIQDWLLLRQSEGDTLSPNDLLFPVTPQTFVRNLHGYLRRAGLEEYGAHLLRHSAARLQRLAGQRLEEVQKFLDHQSIATTSRYVEAMEGQDSGAYEEVTRIIGLQV